MLVEKLRFWSVVSLIMVWVLVQHVIYWPVYVKLIVLLRPLLWVAPRLYWRIEACIYNWFITLFSLVTWYNGHKVTEYGANIGQYRQKRCIIMPNHQSLADVPIMFSILQKYDVYKDFMWIMDRILKYTHFGFCAFHHGDCFVQQKTGSGRDREMQLLSDHVRDWYYPLDRRWVLIFPEGGFLYKRREKSQSYAKTHDLPILEHVALPRLGGVQVLFEAMSEVKNGLGKGLEYVIDVTIGHPQNRTMTLPSFMVGTDGPREIHVYYRVFPIAQIPQDQLTQWLYQIYVEKERLLAYFYEHGQFPRENGYVKRGPCYPTDYPWYRFITITAFFMFFGLLSIYYIDYKIFSCLTSMF